MVHKKLEAMTGVLE